MIKKGLSTRAQTIIAICCFVAVFVAMVVVVSVNNGALDLAVSDKIVDLEPGAYLTHNGFAFFFEACGETVIYLFAALAMGILFWFCLKCIKFTPWDKVFAFICACLAVVAFWFYFKTIIGYVMDHYVGFGWKDVGAEGYPYAMHKSDIVVITFIEIAASLVGGALMIFAFKSVKEQTLFKLAKWVIAFIIAAAVASILIELIKRPVGRMRYRTMNFFGDTNHNGFTAWYVANGKRYGPDEYKWLADTHDMYKSFPSGHTCAAGTMYALIMLPVALGIKNKGIKAISIIAPILYVGLVASSRIVAGAHYFSDVLFGGTIAFVCQMVVHEIIVCKSVHFKSLGKNFVEPEEEIQDAEIPEQDAESIA